MRQDKVTSLIVPRFKELSISKIWSMIQEIDDVMIYFPDYKPNEKPERSYLIAVISTLNPEATKEIIENARKQRAISIANDQTSLVKLTSEMWDAIRSSNLQKSKQLMKILIKLTI